MVTASLLFGAALPCLQAQESPIAELGSSRRPLSQADRNKELAVLIDFTKFNEYQFCLLSIPMNDLGVLSKANFTTGNPWYPNGYGVVQKDGFTFQIPTEFNGKFESGIGHRDRFVKVEGIDSPIPLSVARGLSDAFLCGLVSRLFLTDYFEAAELDLPLLTVASLAAGDMSLSPGLQDQFKKFLIPHNYGYRAKSKTSSEEKIQREKFDQRLGIMLRDVNVQPTGLLLGWKCGSDMLDATKEDAMKRKTAVYRLARERFSLREFAKCASYSISYLEGWSQAVKPGALAKEDLATTLDTMRLESASTKVADVLFRYLLADYAAVLAAEGSPTTKNARAMNDLVEGFYEGTSAAADELFKDAYALGFDDGFQKGLKDGYASGYAAGKSDMISKGYTGAAGKFKDATQQTKKKKQDPLDRFVKDTKKVVETGKKVAKFVAAFF